MGIPCVELTVAVNVTAEPGAAVAGATRFSIVGKAVTCTAMLSLLAKKTASPLYDAVMLWLRTPLRTASTAADPLTKGAVPSGLDPSRNVTVPVGLPELPGAAATLAMILTLLSIGIVGADTVVTLTRPVVMAPNNPPCPLFGSPTPSDRKASA